MGGIAGRNQAIGVEKGDLARLQGALKPRNRLAGMMGHSMLQQGLIFNNPGTNPDTQYRLHALPAWVSILTNGQLVFSRAAQFAVSGSTSYDMATTQLTSMLASNVGVVFLWTGHNDRTAGWALDDATSSSVPQSGYTLPNVRYTIQKLTAIGKHVVLLGELPSGNTSSTGNRFTGNNLAAHLGYRAWCLDQAPSLAPGQVWPVDLWRDVYDNGAGATAGDIVNGYTQDSVHLNASGSWRVASRRLTSVVQGLGLPPRSIPIHVPGDAYDATYNPGGNMLTTNAHLVGFGITLGSAPGTSGGATWAAGLPSPLVGSYSGSGASLTITPSLVTGTATGDWLKINIAGTTGAGTPAVYIDYQPNTTERGYIGAADLVAGFGEFQIDAATTGLISFSQEVTLFNADAGFEITRALYGDMLGSNESGVLDTPVASTGITSAWDGAGLWNPHRGATITSSSYIRHRINLKPSGTISANVYMRNLALRKWSAALVA